MMMINQLVILSLREKWLRLRVYRFSGSVLTDYRIIKNYAHRLMTREPKV